VARPRALEFRRGQGRNGSTCGTNSFTGPRERAEAVGWLGDRAGSRARQWLPGGGHGRNHSGELAARAGQQASAGATGGPKGVGSSTSWRGKAGGVEFIVWHPWRTAAARCSRGEKTDQLYSRAQGGEGGFLAHQGDQVMAWTAAWPEYGGMGGDARRPIANQGRRGACMTATPLGAGTAGVSTWRAWRGSERRFDAGGPTAHGLAGSRLPRRSDPRGRSR
jgi:hypothetical protein